LWELLDNPTLLPFDLDSYKILNRFLDKKIHKSEILDLSRPQQKFSFG
jgi:hypothetical protein